MRATKVEERWPTYLEKQRVSFRQGGNRDPRRSRQNIVQVTDACSGRKASLKQGMRVLPDAMAAAYCLLGRASTNSRRCRNVV